MRALALLAMLALPAQAETISQELGRAGLTVTAERLSTVQNPSDADRFALGGVRFLAAVEGALQSRWAAGLTDPTGMLPFLRVPIAENPNAAQLDPALFSQLFERVDGDMALSRKALAGIATGADFGLEINFADLWFDINANQSRDPGEDLLAVLGPMLLGWQWDSRDPATPAPIIRFDAADAAWLSAYTHLVQGVSQILLAYDPTEPVARISAARDRLLQLGPISPDLIFGGGGAGFDSVDIAAILLAALNQTPDTAHMTFARDHLLAMIADNRRFWIEVAAETDNAAEWLPNDAQVSALGITLPKATGAIWQNVLDDAEALLTGKKLVPYWRIDGAGVNLAKLFTDPRPIDLAGWIQGWAAVPYLEKGELISPQNWSAFEQLVGGEAMLLSFYLN